MDESLDHEFTERTAGRSVSMFMSRALALVFLAAGACGPRAAATPAPTPAPPPADAAPVVACPADAPPILRVVTVSLPDRSQPLGSLEVREGGYAIVHDREGGERSVCLPAAAMDELATLIAEADPREMPPAAIQCAAIPTNETTVELTRRGQSAVYSGPCGVAAHPTVTSLVMRAERLVDEAR